MQMLPRGWNFVSSFSHGASLSSKRPRQDRRDSGVSAAVWEWLGSVHTSFSHGAPLYPKRPQQDRRDSGVSAAMWEWLYLVSPCAPTGRPYPPSGLGRAGGTRVYPPLCGNGWTLCLLVLPRGVPIPQAARAGPEGVGCIRRCVGVPGPCADVGLPRGVPIPQAAHVGPEGLGCIRCCVGVVGPSAYLVLPWGVPIPQAAKAGPEGLGVSGDVWEWLDFVSPRSPMGRPYPPNGRGKTGGTRVSSPLCGSGWALCIPCSQTGRPYPPNSPSRTGGTRVYRPLCGGAERAPHKCSHGASLSPKRPREDRRDSGVCAVVWEWLGPVDTLFSHAASLSPKRPRKDRRDSGVSPAVWGDGEGNLQMLPRGVPIPQMAEAGPEGLGCIFRYVGKECKLARAWTPTGVPNPRRSRAGPGKLGCVHHCVGGGGDIERNKRDTRPLGRPYSTDGPSRTGGTRVRLLPCGGAGPPSAS